jgi:type IV pilus assembly protein PilE
MLVGTSRRSVRGITLIELMITVAIVGILTAIAYPNYRQYVLRGNRTEAKTAMMQASQDLEKCFTRYGRYNHDDCLAFGRLRAGVNSAGDRYQLSFAAVDDPTVEYSIQAQPRAAQAQDVCGTLTLDQTGRRGDSINDAAKCW